MIYSAAGASVSGGSLVVANLRGRVRGRSIEGSASCRSQKKDSLEERGDKTLEPQGGAS